MKRFLYFAASAILLTLTGHGQQSTVTTNSAYADAIISNCAAADWPVNNPQCAPLILAIGKIVLNQSKMSTQPTTIGDTPTPPVQPVSPMPAPTTITPPAQ